MRAGGRTSSTNPPSNVAPGAIDPSCGTKGYFEIGATLSGLTSESGGDVIVATSSGAQRIDGDGKIAKVAGSGSSGFVLGADGKYYGIVGASSGVAAQADLLGKF